MIQLKEAMDEPEDAENDAYAAAEDLRKELLKSECVAIEKSQDELILS